MIVMFSHTTQHSGLPSPLLCSLPFRSGQSEIKSEKIAGVGCGCTVTNRVHTVEPPPGSVVTSATHWAPGAVQLIRVDGPVSVDGVPPAEADQAWV